MDNLHIELTKSTPHIDFQADKNHLLIEGRSYPENYATFFNPIFNWLDTYLQQLEDKCIFDMKLVYVNTSSVKALMMIFDKLEDAYLNNKSIRINWHYDKDNDVAFELGEEFQEDLDIPFNFIKIADDEK
jgi:hypothetical protein